VYATCDDSCHHIEIYQWEAASDACSGTPVLQADNQACDSDPYTHDETDDATDEEAGSTVYYCFEVTVNRDSDDGEEDSVWTFDDQDTLVCSIECEGGP
jgi:hypothetical protein